MNRKMRFGARLLACELNLAVFAFALACTLALIHIASLIPLKVVLDYNEGWNAYRAAAALSDKVSLYPSATSLMSNNYPPLSFYIVAALSHVTGDFVIAGRIVSFVATLSIVGLITFITSAMGCAAREAWLGGFFFLAIILASTHYVGMDDPQLLAHAIGCVGFFCIVGQPRHYRGVILGAFLLTVAGFTKHALVVQPIALGIWLFVFDRRNAWTFLFFGMLFSVLGLLLCYEIWGIDLLERLDSARIYDVVRAANGLGNWLVLGFGSLLAGTFLLVRRTDSYAVLCGLYVFLSLGIGTTVAGGAGVGFNAFFDASIAGALAAAVAISRLKKDASPLWGGTMVLALIVPLTLQVLLDAEARWLSVRYWMRPAEIQVASTLDAVTFIRARKGPALCEMLVLCYWAEKNPEVDSFNFTQQVLTGRRSDQELIHHLDERYYQVIVLDQPSRFMCCSSIEAALWQNYHVAYVDSAGVFLLPRLQAFGS